MTKQHQILAVEPTRQAAAEKQLTECTTTFSKKETLFKGNTRILEMFGKDDTNSVEYTSLEAKDRVDNKVQYTVPENLNYMAGVYGAWLDVMFTKELTNQAAKADVVIDGVTVIEGAPATFLLGLENKMGKLRELYLSMPTLAPGITWTKAEELGPNLWRGSEETDMKTLNTDQQTLLKQSSDKHPDTLVTVKTVKNIGKYKKQEFSGMISVAEKASMIARLDRLLMAIKDARMRANDVDAIEKKCSMSVFQYLHSGFHDEQAVKQATASK